MVLLDLTFALVFAAAVPEAGQAKLSQEAERAALNHQQAELAQKQVEQNVANQEAVKAHTEAVKAYEAEQARVAREYQEAMTKWQADVAACQNGDRKRCAPR